MDCRPAASAPQSRSAAGAAPQQRPLGHDQRAAHARWRHVAVYSDISELKRREGLCWTLIHSTFENYGFFSPPRDPGGVERQVAAFEVGRDEKVSGDACAYRKSNPAILMVQSAQDRAADDIPGPLNAAMDGGILVQ
jgi:hypothetical protein